MSCPLKKVLKNIIKNLLNNYSIRMRFPDHRHPLPGHCRRLARLDDRAELGPS